MFYYSYSYYDYCRCCSCYCRSSYIDSSELISVLFEYGKEKISEEDAQKIINIVDTNKNNKIDFTEFIKLLAKLQSGELDHLVGNIGLRMINNIANLENNEKGKEKEKEKERKPIKRRRKRKKIKDNNDENNNSGTKSEDESDSSVSESSSFDYTEDSEYGGFEKTGITYFCNTFFPFFFLLSVRVKICFFFLASCLF